MLTHDHSLAEVDFVAFDLETTGLYPAVHRIVECGAVRFRIDGGEMDTFEQLVDPEVPIPPRVTAIHGITDAMVRGMPKLPRVLPGFLEFLGYRDAILLAHNATFDYGFLSVAGAKTGLALPENPIIDTLQLARTCVRGSPSHRLEDLVVHLGLADSEEHRALSDSRLVMRLMTDLVNRVKMLNRVGDLFGLSSPLTPGRSRTFLAEPPAGFEELAIACEEQRTMVIVYNGGKRGLGDRTVLPRALVQSNGRQYLIAYCQADKIEKSYRLDRIVRFRAAED